MAGRTISLIDIFEYLGYRMRPIEEGEAVFKAGHVIMCGYKTQNVSEIFALCLQTSALYSPPPEITIQFSDFVCNWKCVCSCKAGNSGRCKHVFAVLIYVNRHEELEVISCTDVKQIWRKEKEGLKQVYEVVPINKFCNPSQPPPPKFPLKHDEEINKRNFRILQMCCSGSSALAIFKNRKPPPQSAVSGSELNASCSSVIPPTEFELRHPFSELDLSITSTSEDVDK